MQFHDTPGVSYERADASRGGIAALRTDVAGFVGLASRGPVGVAVPVESVRQFESWFGAPFEHGYLAYSARGFFENGGRRMWVVRAAPELATTAGLVVHDEAGPAWSIEASSPGTWGNRLSVRVVEVRRAQTRARPDALDRTRLHVDAVAGFAPATLVEVRAGAVRELAIVASSDAASMTLTLRQPLRVVDTQVRVRVETVAHAIDVFDGGERIALYDDVASVPGHPRYGPWLLQQPWRPLDPRTPDAPPDAAADAALASAWFRIGHNRGAIAPPPIVLRELRSPAARAMPRPFTALVVADAAAPPPAAALPRVAVALAGGADALSTLESRDFIGESMGPSGEMPGTQRGLALLEAIDELCQIAVPDIHVQPVPVHLRAPLPECVPDPCLPGPPAMAPVSDPVTGDMPPRFDLDAIQRVQAAMVAQCERRRDRIALLDAPFDTCNRLDFAADALRAWRQRFDTPFAALYAPWLSVVDPLRTRGARQATRPVPPSGHMAGQYAAVDLRTGVHASAANIPLRWVQDVTLALDDARHGMLNAAGINVLRAQPGRGVRALGARTLSSDTDWRFVCVRRLVSMIAKAIDISIQWAVFEPNDWRTRTKLVLVVGTFLRELWARGALAGTSLEEAYYVRCDESNNPPDARDRGRLLMEVGVAPTNPFEFIVLRIGRDSNGFALDAGPAATTDAQE